MHTPTHRKPGHTGTFTIHAPADYRPRHLAVGQWADRVTGRTDELAFVPPEDLVYIIGRMHPHGDCS